MKTITKIKLTIVLLSIFAISSISNAQVIVSDNNATTGNSSAVLDVISGSGDKGLLIPRVSIPSLLAAAPVSSPATGLLVYNTNSTTGPGFFYWNGSAWTALSGSIASESDPVYTAWDKDYADLTNKPTIPTVPTNVSVFTNDASYLTSYTETDPVYTAWDKDYADLTNKPTIPTVPTNVSAFINDASYLTSYTETDPVYTAWDKDYADLTNKPTILNSQWTTTGSNIYYNTGNVGIGTTTPSSKLHIAGSDMNIALLFENTSANPGRNYILFKTQGTEQGYIGLGGGATNHMSVAAYGASNNLFLETNGTVKMTVLPSGNVGIGTTAPSSKLTVNDGNIGVQSAGVTKGYLWWDDGNSKFGVGPGSSNNSFMFNPSTSTVNFNGASCNGTTWANASDSRLKRDIQPMSKYGLSTVMQLKPVTYFYKADKTNHLEVGFIAQEVQKIVPEVVSGTEGDIAKGETLGLSYGNLVPVLTKAIQEQQAEIEALKKQIEELTKTVNNLTK
jgi:hypothetical protein